MCKWWRLKMEQAQWWSDWMVPNYGELNTIVWSHLVGGTRSDSPCLNAGPAVDTAGTGMRFAPLEASAGSSGTPFRRRSAEPTFRYFPRPDWWRSRSRRSAASSRRIQARWRWWRSRSPPPRCLCYCCCYCCCCCVRSNRGATTPRRRPWLPAGRPL